MSLSLGLPPLVIMGFGLDPFHFNLIENIVEVIGFIKIFNDLTFSQFYVGFISQTYKMNLVWEYLCFSLKYKIKSFLWIIIQNSVVCQACPYMCIIMVILSHIGNIDVGNKNGNIPVQLIVLPAVFTITIL